MVMASQLWASSSPAEWRRMLARYQEVLQGTGKDKLVELDRWAGSGLEGGGKQRRGKEVCVCRRVGGWVGWGGVGG